MKNLKYILFNLIIFYFFNIISSDQSISTIFVITDDASTITTSTQPKPQPMTPLQKGYALGYSLCKSHDSLENALTLAIQKADYTEEEKSFAVKYILDTKYDDPNIRTSVQSHLGQAVKIGSLPIIREFLSRSEQNSAYKEAINLAFADFFVTESDNNYISQAEAYRVLLSHYKKQNKNYNFSNPLLWCCNKTFSIYDDEDFTNTVQVLLDEGVDINYENGQALRNAAEKNNIRLVLSLLNNGARTDLKSNSGQTAKDIAIANNFEGIINLFAARGL